MKIFVPSARQRWFLENLLMEYFGDALGFLSAKEREILKEGLNMIEQGIPLQRMKSIQ